MTKTSEGYHIFAAAIAAKFLPEWGVKHHEAVTLLIRDIANPSSSDPFFPVFRHKVKRSISRQDRQTPVFAYSPTYRYCRRNPACLMSQALEREVRLYAINARGNSEYLGALYVWAFLVRSAFILSATTTTHRTYTRHYFS